MTQAASALFKQGSYIVDDKPKHHIDAEAFWKFIKDSCPSYEDIENNPELVHFTPGHYQSGWIGCLNYIESLLKKCKAIN